MDKRAGAARMAGLVRDYGERAFRFAFSLTGNVEEARDLVQEAYRRVLDRWSRYDPGKPLEHWLLAVLRNLFLDVARRFERSHVVSLDAPVPEVEEDAVSYADVIPAGEEEVLLVLERAESVELVREAMGGLNYEYRAILAMCDMQGMTYGQIAAVTGSPIGTVRSRISRARRQLKRRLLERKEARTR